MPEPRSCNLRDVLIGAVGTLLIQTALLGVPGNLKSVIVAPPATITMHKPSVTTTPEIVRELDVLPMCRCNSGRLPVLKATSAALSETGVLQERSIATGGPKQFRMRHAECECSPGRGPNISDKYLATIEKQWGQLGECLPMPKDTNMTWDAMPDFGVEQRLPMFLGVLSYKSPVTMEWAMANWVMRGLQNHVTASFVQLNARSSKDDEVVGRRGAPFNFTMFGSAEENIHPGKAIARFCRAAERHPKGHPNGENLLLFLEKDWFIAPTQRYGGHVQKKTGKVYGRFKIVNGPAFYDLAQIFGSANELAQRGVPYLRLLRPSGGLSPARWPCSANNYTWECTPANQHRWTNLPLIVRCDWFLRYLEPFALLNDPIMYACRRNGRQKKFCDWEEAMQDGRIAWANAHWVVGSIPDNLWQHVEFDNQ